MLTVTSTHGCIIGYVAGRFFYHTGLPSYYQ